MNFLAHLYLSGASGELMIGNFIADSVTRKMHGQFSPRIIQGIELHHAIDRFTDSHAVVAKSKNHLRPTYGKYSGVIIDIFYDHFLASNWESYSSVTLRQFVDTTQAFLGNHTALFPERVKKFYSYMILSDSLFNYSRIDGIKKVMEVMSRRASFNSGMQNCTVELLGHYNDFRSEFNEFFPQLQKMVSSFVQELPQI